MDKFEMPTFPRAWAEGIDRILKWGNQEAKRVTAIF